MKRILSGRITREGISLNTNPGSPKRGEIWVVNFDPTIGAEIRKSRPAVVISSDAVGRLPIKLIAPITDWKRSFGANLWHLQIRPNQANGLTKISAVDTLQIPCRIRVA